MLIQKTQDQETRSTSTAPAMGPITAETAQTLASSPCTRARSSGG